MGSENTITKVYDIQTVGGKDAYQTLNGINNLFKEIATNKTSLNGVFNVTVDTSKFGKLDQSIKELIAGIKTMTAQMKELGQIGSKMAADITAAMDKVNMATLKNIAGFRAFQQTVSTGNIVGYSDAIASLGGKLSFLKDQATITTDGLKRLKEEFDKNLISEEEYTRETAGATTELSLLKTQITEVGAAMTTMNKLFNPGLTKEETIALAENRIELLKRNQLLKLNAVAEQAANGSISEARSQAALYRKELQDLNLTTEEGVARQKELIASIDELDAFIKANSEAYTRQKINIGNYPELTVQSQELKAKMDELTASGQTETQVFRELEQESLKLAAAMKSVSGPSAGGINTTAQQLSALKVNMQGLVAAGKEDTAEFRLMQAEAQRLTTAINEVNVSIKGATTVGHQFGNIVQRMGLRMIANLLIFQAAIELGQHLWEAWTRDAKAAKEYADAIKKIDDNVYSSAMSEQQKLQVLLAISQDTAQAMKIRVEAVQKLQSEYPNYLGNLSKEAILTGKITEEVNKLNAALFSKALMEANFEKAKLSANKYADLQDQLAQAEERRKNLAGGPLSAVTTQNLDQIRQGDKRIKEIRGEMAAVKAEIDKYNAAATEFGKAAAGVIVDPKKEKTKKEKEVHDYTNAILEAQKKLTDFTAKELETRLQIEMLIQKEIFDNTERSLADRLQAYAQYATNEKRLLQIQKDTEIKDVQDKLNKITEIENAIANKKAHKDYDKTLFDKSGNLKEQEQVLLINKDELTEQLAYINTEYRSKLEQLNINIGKGITTITTSSVSKILKDIEQEAATKIAELEERATKAKEKVKGSKETRDNKTEKINLGLNVDKDNVELNANTKEQNAVQEQLQEAHTSKRVDEEAAFQKQLIDLQNKAAALREKLRADEEAKKDKDLEKDKLILDTLKNQSIEAFEQIGNAYLQMLEQQAQARERNFERNIDWNKKEMNSQAQSLAETRNNERASFIAQQQLEKEQFENKKKMAKAQMALDYATAVMRIWASYKGDFGVTEGIEIAAVTGVYFAKLALMEQQQFGSGGEVPGSGGMFGGSSHASGGTPFIFKNRGFEAEAGELAIINKRSAGSNQNMTVSGTPKQIASAVNAYGGGANFAPGGQMYKFEYGGGLGSQIQAPAFISDYYTQRMDRNSGNNQNNEMYAAIMAQTAAINRRIDTIHVVLNPHSVTDYQNSHIKKTQVGTL